MASAVDRAAQMPRCVVVDGGLNWTWRAPRPSHVALQESQNLLLQRASVLLLALESGSPSPDPCLDRHLGVEPGGVGAENASEGNV